MAPSAAIHSSHVLAAAMIMACVALAAATSHDSVAGSLALREAVAAGATRQAVGAAPVLAPRNDDAWVLTFEDDFNGPTLNTSLWQPRNNESHCAPCEAELYMDDEVYLESGNLVLRTRRRSMTGPHGQQYNFTSGWVDTEGRWFQQFGRFEVNASLPAPESTGVWPAHWLMPNPATATPKDVCWPVGGEIDIMEYTANDLMNSIAGSYRWGTSCGSNKQVLPGSFYPPLFSGEKVNWTEYHVFSLEWDKCELRFFVDDVNYHNKTCAEANISTDPMYMILNTAIAWYWMPGPDAVFPAYHRIEWVRAYQAATAASP